MNMEIKDKRKEIAIRNKEATIYDLQYTELRNLIEISSTLKNFKIKKMDLILEVGAGTGRFTRQFMKHGGKVVAVDFSINSLKINRFRCNSDIVLADICYLPFKSSVFDKVAGIGVFHHIPSSKSRFLSLKEVKRVLKAKGQFLMTTYNKRVSIRHWKEKQGYHSYGMIYYYLFNFLELKNLLNSIFSRIVDNHGIIFSIYDIDVISRIAIKLMRTFRLTKIALTFESLIEKTMISLLFGDRLVTICEK